jgi:DNA-binding response OmpR family regulator
MDPRTRSVRCDGRDVLLCPVEFELLRALMTRAGQVQSRSQLEAWLRGMGRMTRGSAVPVHIHHLRRKIGGEHIRTVRGAGYVLPPDMGDW